MSDPYNLFFYCTVCHVCKSAENVKTCGGCKIISYCSVSHQKQHWSIHKKFCKCIQNLATKKHLSFFEMVKKSDETVEWLWNDFGCMVIMETFLARKLLPFEIQMFMFPKVCEFCRELCQNEMYTCSDCLCVSYCSIFHKETLFSCHKEVCNSLKLCFQLDKMILRSSDLFGDYSVPFQESLISLPQDMCAFIKHNFSSGPDPSSQQVALASESLTCPLSLLYCLENRFSKNKLILHVVGASVFELTFVHAWESVLHWIPCISSLCIVFIGPEVAESMKCKCVSNVLCQKCTEKGGVMITKFYRSFYHEYVNSKFFEMPDVVLVFNCGLHENEGTGHDTWKESVPYLVGYEDVYLLISSYTEVEAEKDLDRLNHSKAKATHLKVCVKNPFASLRPMRTWLHNQLGVYYHNNYLSFIGLGRKPFNS
ncbi:putative protein MSS51 homolog, mitochondrial [Bacillus rossius redtenbacheri]|uniref:putative protein MSS51 homolog, mitochondrial n=1 Tax=Bacillus rossius redtenbacheri TaxID=93214 RepID=UPI002FDE219C